MDTILTSFKMVPFFLLEGWNSSLNEKTSAFDRKLVSCSRRNQKVMSLNPLGDEITTNTRKRLRTSNKLRLLFKKIYHDNLLHNFVNSNESHENILLL